MEEIILNEEHLKTMFLIQNGATIFGLKEAILIREVEKYDKSLINIISNIKELEEILGNKKDLYDNKNPKTGRLAYFGAILTEKGKKWLDNECRKRGKVFI